MLSLYEKIEVLNKQIDMLTETKNHMFNYIDLINSGMQDSNLSIEFCNNFIEESILKIEALQLEKQSLTNQL